VGALNNLGIVLEKQGSYQQAAGHHRQALTIAREIGHPDDEVHALDNLGVVERMQCHYEQAAGHHQQALTLFREIGHRSAEAHALDNLAVVERLRGRYQQAADRHQQALALFRALGDRSGEAQALNGIGETLHASGRPERAHAEHTMAFGLASQIGNKHEQARAHNGLACAHGATGDPARAGPWTTGSTHSRSTPTSAPPKQSRSACVSPRPARSSPGTMIPRDKFERKSMTEPFRPVAPVDPTNLRPLLFLFRRGLIEKSRYPSLPADVPAVDYSGWPIYCRTDTPDALVGLFCEALVRRRDDIVWDIGGVHQPPLPLERMVKESPVTPLDVPMHPRATAVWRQHGYL